MSDATTMQRDLDVVDDALATGAIHAADPAERELRELALLLQADAPEPDPAFARDLREQVVAGFPRRKPHLARRALHSTKLRIGGGVAVAAMAAFAVWVASQPPGVQPMSGVASDEAASMRGDGAADDLLPNASPESTTIAPGEPPPGSGGDFAPGREQRIARSAALTLAAPGDELGTLADRVTEVTGRHRGYVLRSDVTAGGDSGGGHLELRVPATELRAAMRDLSALASVRSTTQSGEDVTGRFVGVRDQLDARKAERIGLLRRLENAETDTQADALRRRVLLVSSEINRLRGELRQLRLRTDYAALSVFLERTDDGAAAPGSTEDALDDSLGILQGALNVALRAAAVLLPFAAIGIAFWLIATSLRRRRREAVLDA